MTKFSLEDAFVFNDNNLKLSKSFYSNTPFDIHVWLNELTECSIPLDDFLKAFNETFNELTPYEKNIVTNNPVAFGNTPMSTEINVSHKFFYGIFTKLFTGKLKTKFNIYYIEQNFMDRQYISVLTHKAINEDHTFILTGTRKSSIELTYLICELNVDNEIIDHFPFNTTVELGKGDSIDTYQHLLKNSLNPKDNKLDLITRHIAIKANIAKSKHLREIYQIKNKSELYY